MSLRFGISEGNKPFLALKPAFLYAFPVRSKRCIGA